MEAPYRLPEIEAAVQRYRQELIAGGVEVTVRGVSRLVTISDIQSSLKGLNLGCWCRMGLPCHADVLLELANQWGQL